MAKQKITPSQQNVVAFRAYRNAALTATTGTPFVVFDTVQYNYGSGYNSSTGYFTAPVSGVYVFNAAIATDPSSTARTFYTPSGTAAGIYRTRSGDGKYQASSLWRQQGVWQVYMNAGETFGLGVYSETNNSIQGFETWFGGYLVMGV